MKSKGIAVLVIFLFLLILSGCAPEESAAPVLIVGDVDQVFEFSNTAALESVSANGKSYKALPLEKVLEEAGPQGLSRVTFVGADKHTATIEVGDLADSFLAWSSENGWQFVSGRYPINTAIKNIKEIIVQGDGRQGLFIIDSQRNYPAVTPGQILSQSHWLYFHPQGQSAREVDGVQYQGTVVSRHALRQVRDLVPGSVQKVLAVGQDGSMHLLSKDSYLEAYGNMIYLNRFDSTPRLPLVGLVLDPPERCITDLFQDVLSLVEQDEKVLVVLVDGFSYPLYEAAARENLAPNILKGAAVDRALSVYPSITPCCCAAMLSGKTPDQTGVQSRKDRVLQVPGILEELEKRGKKGVIIEGNTIVINMEGEVKLNTDRNQDGQTDDEILESALEHLRKGNYDLVFVHFHSVDDCGHTYGPLAAETKKQLTVIDGYVGKLFAAWEGKRILLSDHGMHDTDDGGNHGEFRCEDMYVPYVSYN